MAIENAPNAVDRSAGLSRRRFMGASLASVAGAGLLAPPALGRSAPADRARASGRPTARNVIFLIADGMSIGTLTLADMMHRRTTGKPCHWCSLWLDPKAKRSMVRTHAADSIVTDSAAAGTAWSTGESINNGALNITPDGRSLTPILRAMHERGLRTGSVTSTSLTDATPASFMAVSQSRNDAPRIAGQIAEGPYDIALGGGVEHFGPELLDRPGLTLARTADELRRAGRGAPMGARLLGLFSRGHTPYELDRPAGVPDLATMTWVALDRLHAQVREDARDDAGFVLQVEGGRVDHAAHANDACGMLHDQLAFDRAVGVALRYARTHEDTLVIVTTDHGNANPGITLYGQAGIRGLERVEKARHSFSWIFDQIRVRSSRGGIERAGDPETMLTRIVREAVGVTLRTDEAAWVAGSIFDRQQRDGFEARNSASSVLASVLANHLAVSFVSRNHTSDMVDATAYGPGSRALGPVVHITDLHHLAMEALAARA